MRAAAAVIVIAGATLVAGCGASTTVTARPTASPSPHTQAAVVQTPSPTSAVQAQAESVCAMFDTAAPSQGSVSEKGIGQAVSAAVPLSDQYKSLFNGLFAAQQEGFLASIKAGGDDILVPAEQVGAFATALAKVRAECHTIAFGQ